MKKHAALGVWDHAGWAVFMTVGDDGELLDRRKVTLVAEGLPVLVYHHDAQRLPMPQAVALVEKVQASAEKHARQALAALFSDVKVPIDRIALRRYRPIPPTIEARLTDYTAQNVADTVMIRLALADAAMARTWAVHWYEPKDVAGDAEAALGRGIGTHLDDTYARVGRPWQKDHRTAMAAAISVLTPARRPSRTRPPRAGG